MQLYKFWTSPISNDYVQKVMHKMHSASDDKDFQLTQ